MTSLRLYTLRRGASILAVALAMGAALGVAGCGKSETVAVHAVQTVIHEPVELERWPDDDRRSRLVFITRGLGRAGAGAGAGKAMIAGYRGATTLAEQIVSVEAFRLAIPRSDGAPRTIDPAQYAQFLDAAQRFR